MISSPRTDLDTFFSQSNILTAKRLNHTPFAALTPDGVKIITLQWELLTLPDETPVLAQWRGEWSSDYFQFTVGDVRKAMGK